MGYAEDFKKDGYVLLRNVLNDEDLQPLIGMLSNFIDKKIEILYEAGKIPDKFEELAFEHRWAKVCSIQYENVFGWNQDVFSKEIYDLLQHSKLLSAVEPLIGPEITANGDYWVRPKLPNEAITTYPWHQDAFYYGGKPAGNLDMQILTVWIPLVDVDAQNGCLQVIPESDSWGLIPNVRNSLNQLEPAINVEDRGQVLTMEMKKGDVLILNQLVFHKSLPNQSDHIRWNIDLRYSPTDQPFTWHSHEDFVDKFPPMVCRSVSNPGREASWEEWNEANRNRKI